MCNIFAILLGAGLALFGSDARGQAESSSAEYKGWTVVAFDVTGVEKHLANEVRKGLAIPNQFGRFVKRSTVFYPQTLADDMNRARLYLARRGFPYARIEPRFEPRGNGKRLSITLHVELGAPVRIERLQLQGFPQHLEGAGVTRLRPSDTLDEDRVEREVASAAAALRGVGYARAAVRWHIDIVDSFRVDLYLSAEPGQRYVFGDVSVAGTSPDLVGLVKRTVDLDTGRLYSPVTVRRARSNLQLLDLFRQVRLDARDASGDTLNLHADLIPRKMRTVETGIGYWTDERVRVRARWSHRNLFARGRGLSVRGSATQFLQRASVSTWWPALLWSRSREVLAATIESQREDSYDLLSIGGEISSNYRFSVATSIQFGVGVSNIDITVQSVSVDAFTGRDGLLTNLFFRWNRTATDDRLSPTRGSVTWLRSEWAPNGWLSDYHYVLGETGVTLYRPLASDVVGAARIQVGLAEPTGESRDLLPNKRFYAGGASSMRGFARRKLGPLDDSGAPLGGEAKLEAAAELRFPLVWRLRGALFVDSGQVWRHIDAIAVDELEVAIGPGLMFRTPVGPIRADIGWRITDRETSQRRWAFHLSIGQPF